MGQQDALYEGLTLYLLYIIVNSNYGYLWYGLARFQICVSCSLCHHERPEGGRENDFRNILLFSS